MQTIINQTNLNYVNIIVMFVELIDILR